ncbi:hypothetical protein E2562_020466 [Oryza meyeriana var. granulata]|uniref:Uncharacterized protein n=1 Tax=Oryza meyeriana var. granulata TaxID=110450 RepID=A0A6G1D5X1_9ORYZ|nr:hypothetical protein E2562_020466 [Oryza meyeriana var. granulata]
MASSVRQPAAAAAVWPRFLPSPRRSAATQTYQVLFMNKFQFLEQTYQVLSMNKFQRKRPFSGSWRFTQVQELCCLQNFRSLCKSSYFKQTCSCFRFS